MQSPFIGSRRLFWPIVAVAAALAGAPALAQASTEVRLGADAVISLSPDRKVAIFRAQGAERSIETQSAFFRLDAVYDGTGAVVGASLVESWPDHWTTSVYRVTPGGVDRLVSYDSASPTAAITDWDGDGDLDVAVPDASGLYEAFLHASADVAVYEQAGDQTYKASASCFPLYAAYLRNAAASIESQLRTLPGLQQAPVWRADLPPSEVGRIPGFIEGLRANLARPCERTLQSR